MKIEIDIEPIHEDLKQKIIDGAAYLRVGDPLKDVMNDEDIVALVLWADHIIDALNNGAEIQDDL